MTLNQKEYWKNKCNINKSRRQYGNRKFIQINMNKMLVNLQLGGSDKTIYSDTTTQGALKWKKNILLYQAVLLRWGK